GVCRIDGDQRDVPPVLAPAQRDFLRLVRLLEHAAREAIGDLEVVDGDEAHRPLGPRIADHIDDAGAGYHEPAGELRLDLDKVAVARIPQVAAGDPHLTLLAIDRHQPRAVFVHADDADLPAPG